MNYDDLKDACEQAYDDGYWEGMREAEALAMEQWERGYAEGYAAARAFLDPWTHQ